MTAQAPELTAKDVDRRLRRLDRELSGQLRGLRRRVDRISDRLAMEAGTDFRSPYYDPDRRGPVRGRQARCSRHSSAVRAEVRTEVRRALRRRTRRYAYRQSGTLGSASRLYRINRARRQRGPAAAGVYALLRWGFRPVLDLLRIALVVLLVLAILWFWVIRPAMTAVMPDFLVPGPVPPGQEQESLGETLPPNGMSLAPASMSRSASVEARAAAALAAIRAAGFPAAEERRALMVMGAESEFIADVDGPTVVLPSGAVVDHDGLFQVQSSHVSNPRINPAYPQDRRKDPVVNARMALRLLEGSGGRWEGPWLASRARWSDWSDEADAALAAAPAAGSSAVPGAAVAPYGGGGAGCVSSAVADEVPEGGLAGTAYGLATKAREVAHADASPERIRGWLREAMFHAGRGWELARQALNGRGAEPRVPRGQVAPSGFGGGADCVPGVSPEGVVVPIGGGASGPSEVVVAADQSARVELPLALQPREQRVARFMLAQVGEPYVFGGTGPNGWDCSGLLWRAWAEAGRPMRVRTAAQMWSQSDEIPRSQARAGDIVFSQFGKGRGGVPNGPGHMTIVLNAGQVVEAPRTGLNVRVRPMPGDARVFRLRDSAFARGVAA